MWEALLNWLRSTLRAARAWVALIGVIAGLLLAVAQMGFQPLALGGLLLALIGAITLFTLAQQASPQTTQARTHTTLLTPRVVVSEVRAAALITHAQIGTVTIRKERSHADRGDPFKPLLDLLAGERLVMSVGVRVIAGVNLRHLHEADVTVRDKRVEIRLPPAKVLMVYVDESLTQVVFHRTGWFSARDIRMMDAARREAMDALVEAALDNDLLEKANAQAAHSVTALLKGLGFEEVIVYPQLPPRGAHFEELQDPAEMALLRAQQPMLTAREDQAGD